MMDRMMDGMMDWMMDWLMDWTIDDWMMESNRVDEVGGGKGP